MKKLTVLVALALCVIIGGVYATWIYAGTAINPVTGQSIPFQMGDDELTDSAGAYSLENNTLKVYVEPAEGTYDTTLVFEGSATLVFTPTDDTIAPASLAAALGATFEVHCPNNADVTYDSKNIFTLENGGKAVLVESEWAKKGDRYEFTIDGEFLSQLISINEFTLDLHQEYLAFEQQFLKVAVHFAVYPAGTTSTPH